VQAAITLFHFIKSFPGGICPIPITENQAGVALELAWRVYREAGTDRYDPWFETRLRSIDDLIPVDAQFLWEGSLKILSCEAPNLDWTSGRCVAGSGFRKGHPPCQL
jgi:hypothetical protein